jgi:hypothetical protein
MNLTGEERREIDAELDRARAALASGNDGKARVCARRGAGIALRAHYRASAGGEWNGDAQSLLLKASTDPLLGPEVRDAALRLTTSVTRKDSAPFSTDPVGDALSIVARVGDGGS